MKKIMLSAAILAFAGMATVNAGTVNSKVSIATVMQFQDRTPVKAADLPDAVKEALAGEEYSEWSIKEAFAVAPAEGVPFFEISLQKGDENRVVNLNEAGEVVDLPVASPATPTQELVPSEPTPSEPTPSEPTPSEPVPSEPTPSEPTERAPSEPTPTEIPS